jgi:hypothetical protein
MGGTGKTPVPGMLNQLPPIGGAKKLYCEAVHTRVDKRFTLLVKFKLNLSTDAIKNALKKKVNHTVMKVSIKAFKSLKDGRVLIEVGTSEEIKLISTSIRDNCGEDLEVTVPKLRKPRLIIHNVPQDTAVENLDKIILAQNPELGLISGDIEARYTYRNKRGLVKMVVEFGSEKRKKLLHKKLKIGWLICNIDDYLVAKRCFNCCRFNHRHQDCKGEEICPLCAESHKLKECNAQAEHYKCINSMM